MRLTKIVSLLLILTIIINSCTKDMGKHSPVGDNTAVPEQVTNIKVTNGAGSATISYTIPKDSNLLYIKAVYTLSTGQQYVAKSSYYNNSVQVEGFADTLSHEIKLYSVSRSEVESQPIAVTIKPLTAPIWNVFRSIKINNAFGGYNLTAANATKADVSIIVTSLNAVSEYESDKDKSIYTNADTIVSKVRGLDTSNYRFGFLVKDRWGNRTDTLYQPIKPLYETTIPISGFKEHTLPGDAALWYFDNGDTHVYNMWDNYYYWPSAFTTQTWGSQPHMITFDMGALVKVSRTQIFPYFETPGGAGPFYYYLTTMKRFEIYGSVSPNPNGDLDDTWKLLGSYTVVKPSGLPYGQENATDLATARAGLNWEADITVSKVRYIRIRCLENFGGGTALSVNEIRMFGDPR